MGIGSWPRPRWMLQAMHEHLEGRLDRGRLPGRPPTTPCGWRSTRSCAPASTSSPTASSGATTTPASSAAGSTTASSSRSPICCRYVDDPDEVRRGAARARRAGRARCATRPSSARSGRSRPLAVHELRVRAHADRPAGEGGAARPVPADAHDVDGVHLRPRLRRRARRWPTTSSRVLREETARPARRRARRSCSSTSRCSPRWSSAAARRQRTFMCGALGARRDAATRSWRSPSDLLNARRRRACRASDWRCTSAAATGRRTSRWRSAGDYRPLLPLLSRVAGRHALPRAVHAARRRAGGAARSARRHAHRRRRREPEVATEVESRRRDRRAGRAAIALFGAERVLLNPDCGFATFADNPIASADVADAKLAAIVAAARMLRRRHGVAS